MAARRFYVGRDRRETGTTRLQNPRHEPVPVHAALPEKAVPKRSGARNYGAPSGENNSREERQTASKQRFNPVLRRARGRSAGSRARSRRAPGLQRGQADTASLNRPPAQKLFNPNKNPIHSAQHL
jgi:hypothetical protein